VLKDLDTSVHMAGVTFKTPVLVSSSEYTSSPPLFERLIQRPIGGIVTKTFTSLPGHRIRVRPYQFPLNAFGKGYREGKCLFSLAAPHVEDMDRVMEQIPSISNICRHASVKLIVSYFEDPSEVSLWVAHAKAFEAAGADLLELNFSSPSAVRVFSSSSAASSRIISRVKESLSIPVGLKLSPTLEPLEASAAAWSKAGLDFVTAHNAPSGILIDVEREVPFGAPTIGGFVIGRAFLPYSLARIVRIKRATDLSIIGVGGIYNANDALQYLLCGCSLVGVGSALYFQGPGILDEIHKGIGLWMGKKGYKAVNEFAGKVLPMIKDSVALQSIEAYPFTMPPHCPYIPVIDEEKCNLCGICQRSCIYGALKVSKTDSRILVDENLCWSCGLCVGLCPSGAIELRDRSNRDKVIWKNEGMAASFT
jgi:dihydroorotate dehydrogenase (NAD+) catalytic subunit